MESMQRAVIEGCVMKQEAKHNIALWNRYYTSLTESYLFPNEYVLRTFLGTYPDLTMSHNYRGAKVCDISCGDGRNLVLLHKLGLELYATEVSQDICEITRRKLLSHGEKISVDIREGRNGALPFGDNYFDYLLSWNACYYMEDETSDILDHVREFSRILKKGGYLVVSVPTPDCFTLQGAENLGNSLIRINTASRWSILNGSIYHRFDSFDQIVDKFGKEFTKFQKATLMDDCFGITLAYFIFVCQKR
jgi:ubiquinone/menaquinone biosynthesis C-methylase UbiE